MREGKIKYVGLSEASSAEIRAAHAVHPISAVQLEWSLFSRDAEASVWSYSLSAPSLSHLDPLVSSLARVIAVTHQSGGGT